jgi:hypothetical protein
MTHQQLLDAAVELWRNGCDEAAPLIDMLLDLQIETKP